MIVWGKKFKCNTCDFDVDYQRSIEWNKKISPKHSLCDRTLQFDNLYLVAFKNTHL